MITINNNNYTLYKSVFEIIWLNLQKKSPFQESPESSPVYILNEWERRSLSMAKKGLKTGLNDLVNMLKDMSKEDRQSLNLELINNKLPDLLTLVVTVTGTLVKVMKRGYIRTTQEWYIIKEYLDDLESGLKEEERKSLGEMFFDFESKQSKK